MKISSYYIFCKILTDNKAQFTFEKKVSSLEDLNKILNDKYYSDQNLMVLKGSEIDLEEEIEDTLVPIKNIKSRKLKNG